MSENLDEFNKFREEMNKKILESDNLNIKRFFNIDTRTYEEGALSSKTKEMLGLVSSMVLKCDDCISYHLEKCYEKGVTRAEFFEIFNVALVVGGSIVIPHLRRAVELLEELEGEADTENSSLLPRDKEFSGITIYTDGACQNNPGPGAFAAVILDEEAVKKIKGFREDTTNNRMEIMAVIQGLQAADPDRNIRIYSDSNYVIQGISSWIKNWEKNGWQTAADNPVKNKELWQELNQLVKERQVEFKKVEAHSGDYYNEMVDKMAKQEIEAHTRSKN